jgi:hypothetical protein
MPINANENCEEQERKPTKEFDQNDLPRSKYVEICYKKTTN